MASRLRGSVVLALLVACGGDSPTGPGPVTTPPPEPIALGDTVTAELSVSQATRTYILHAAATDSLVLFGQAIDGYTLVTITDSTVDQDIGFLGLDDPDRPLVTTFTRFQVAAGGTYLLRVRGSTPGVGSFRLVVGRVLTTPESRPAAATVGVIEEGEALETGADIDEFTVTGEAGDELVAYFEGLDGQPLQSMILAVFDDAGPAVLTAVRNESAGEGLQGSASRSFVLPHDGAYRIVVHGEYGWTVAGRDDAGRYRFQLHQVVRAPEQLGSAVTPGDTVGGEALDYAGDVDEFTFTAEQGRLYNLFVQSLSDDPYFVTADVFSGTTMRAGATAEAGQALFRRGTGRFIAEEAGPYTIRVYDFENNPGPRPFRIYLYAIDTLPESVPAAMPLNGSVTGERLELPGDIDDFSLAVPGDTLLNLVLAKPTADSARPVVYLYPPGGTDPSTVLYSVLPADGPGESTALTGVLPLGPGSWRLRVDGGTGGRDEYGGSYRLQSWGLSMQPEGVAASIPVGAVVDEALSPAGDMDRYVFTGTQGQLINVTFAATAPATGAGDFIAYLQQVGVSGPSLIAVAYTTLGASPFAGQTGRVHLPADGTYEILVRPNSGGTAPAETGPYRVSLLPVDPAPEHVAATLPLAGGVVGEAIDSSGDIDRFTLTAAPGSEFEILSRFTSPHFNLRIETLSETGDVPDRFAPMPTSDFPLGRFVIPPSGKLRLQVYEYRVGFEDGYTVTGGYTVTAVPINRAPETIGAAAPRNVVVQGERIDLIGDVDEFQFAGSAGEQLRAFFNTPQGIPGGTLTLEVVAPGGNVLGSLESGNPAFDIRDRGTSLLTLPANGTYLIRVRGTLDTAGEGLYEFLIED